LQQVSPVHVSPVFVVDTSVTLARGLREEAWAGVAEMSTWSGDASQTFPAGRRQFVVRVIQAVHGAIGATLAVIVGRALGGPVVQAGGSERWLPAAELSRLEDGRPTTVSLRVVRRDGMTDVVDRRVVYLVRRGETVRALDSTCTHLGCRTAFNTASSCIECPCHGGVFDAHGAVIGGPPPSPLKTLATRLDGTRVLVQV
jgi:cytochrome b6-f complex iron-sulfur subunit